MGKLEKLIVLAVLFAAAVVLALSLDRGNDEPSEASDPLSGARTLLEEPATTTPFAGLVPASPAPLEPSLDEKAGAPAPESAPSLLLHAGAESDAGTAPAASEVGLTSSLQVERPSDPSSPILLDRQGLRPSFMDEYLLYTVREGDTWSSLAQRFYQDGRFTRNLHLANEGMVELVPGKDVLVPVFDLLAEEVESAPSGLSLPGDEADASLAAVPTAASAAPAEVAPKASARLVYEVRSGDTLSEISLAALGTSTRWKELLDLNPNVLKKPEDLRVGMKLELPAGAKVPTTVKSPPKSSPAKPKVAASEKAQPAPASSSTSTKKKKVL
jgi:nucleoid-associated protein YgaU